MIESELLHDIDFISERDKPLDECGIVVVVSPDYDAAQLAATGIAELQNRGHEMTGLVTETDNIPHVHTGFGTGSDLFPDGGYSHSFSYPSQRSMAHARYSTQGTQGLSGAQPHGVGKAINGVKHWVTHVENGNLMNTHDLASMQGLSEKEYVTDNGLMAHTFMNNIELMLDENPGQPIDTRELMLRTLPMFEGAFTSAVMLGEHIVVYTDHHGHKPGFIGELPNGGVIVASETTALEAVGAEVLRELNPGEMIIISRDGSWQAEQWAVPEPKRCVLEVLYVMKARTSQGSATAFGGIAIADARRRAGRALAQVTPVRPDGSIDPVVADFGFGLPNSGIPVGEGYCEAVGLPHNSNAITANGKERSFIAPTQEKREAVVKKKLTASRDELEGSSVIGGDDSLIRGTVAKKNNELVREAGAREFHMRIGAPMILYTCERGIDLGNQMELLAARAAMNLDIDITEGYDSLAADDIQAMTADMAAYAGLDSLSFLTPQLLREQVLRGKAGEFCMKCMTGEEPNVTPTLVEITPRRSKEPVA